MEDVEQEETTTHLRRQSNLQLLAIPSVTFTHRLMAFSDVQIARTYFMIRLTTSAITRALHPAAGSTFSTLRQALCGVWDLNAQDQDIAYFAVLVEGDMYPSELRDGREDDCDLMLDSIRGRAGWRQPHFRICMVHV